MIIPYGRYLEIFDLDGRKIYIALGAKKRRDVADFHGEAGN